MLLADVPFIPALWLAYQQEISQEKSGFVRSGIIARNAAIEAEFAKGGRSIAIPHFNDLSGDAEILSDTTPLTAATLGGGVQLGVRHLQGRAWTSSDLAAELAGDDPMFAIARRTGEYWVREQQKTLLAALNGVFTGPLAATHVVNGGTAVPLGADSMIDGIATLGDAGQELAAVAMHSGAYYYLAKKDLIQMPAGVNSQLDTRVSAQRAEYGTYLGRPVIVDDTLPRTGSDYGIYFFAPGAVAYAECPAKTPVETDRDVLQGHEVLVNRREFLLHPVGLSWIGTPGGESPTNAEYATGANWRMEFQDPKNVRMVKLVATAA
jgi:hypothetical protein